MKKLKRLADISDGKIYDVKDMVKVDTGGCEGCSACCHGVGDMVVLTPFDMYEITRHLSKSFDELLGDKIELRVDGKIMLPHLKMHGESERCGFLNEKDRCSIHEHRPNICRLFPLGRVYEEGDFKYFLQTGACMKDKLGKVKVKKWLGIKNYQENKEFILVWHEFLKALKFRVKFIREDKEISETNDYLIEIFYRMTLKEDFYTAFYARLSEAKTKLGII